MATKSDARKSEADAKAAEANARAAEAKARADAQSSAAAAAIAKTQADAAALQAETARLARAEETGAAERRAATEKQAADEQRQRDNALNPAVSSAINVAAPIIGMVAGHKLAGVIETRHTASRATANKQLSNLAAGITSAVKSTKISPMTMNKLRAAVTAADKMGLTKVAGPVGLIPAGILLAEGAYSRFVLAEKVDSPAVKEAVRAVGTASAFTATSIVGERLLQNSTPKSLPNANALAKIETARVITAPAGQSAVAKVAASATVKQVVGKVLTRAVPVLGALLYAKGIADAAVAGANKDGVKGAAFDGVNAATFGLMGLVVDRDKLVGQAQAAAAQAKMTMETGPTLSQPMTMQTPVSDGMVAAHDRHVNGKIVKVGGYARGV